jgi:hypothetical protein
MSYKKLIMIMVESPKQKEHLKRRNEMRRRTVLLSQEQHKELLATRDPDRRPYMRTKAAAILKVADGQQIKAVAHHGLNKPSTQDTVRIWINRSEAEGLTGLRVQLGRGRKPAFSPCASRSGNRRRRGAGHRLPLTTAL